MCVQARDAYKAATVKVEYAYSLYEKQVQTGGDASHVQRVRNVVHACLRTGEGTDSFVPASPPPSPPPTPSPFPPSPPLQATTDWNLAVAEKNERLNEYLLALNVLNAHHERRYEVDQPTMATVSACSCPTARTA